MSDTTKLTAELPKFKDKVMYVSSAISDTKLETSYVISSSFKGIVRLSPNNHTIVREDATHQLSVEDERSQGLIYSDAIVFDNEALSSVKSECDITTRFIIASESTGYLVNFRLSDKSLQFDNLGVIGITQTQGLAIHTSNTTTENPDTFYLGGERMPTLAYSMPSTDTLYKDKDLEEQFNDIGNFHERKVKIIDDNDDSVLLYGLVDNDGKRKWQQKNTKLFINDLVIEALLSLQTIPTGSVHFVPVTIEQYKALCNGGGKEQLPNKTYIAGSKDLGTTDPLIRDFLLCDGRQYLTKDFPELAKILWGEKITVWKYCKGTNHVYPSEHYNKYEQFDEDQTKTFRVPDLRHMFIGAVHALGQKNMNTSVISDATIKSYAQDTGAYFPDNLPVYSRHYKPDNHRHFAAQGTYSSTLFSSDDSFHTQTINKYITKHPNKTLKMDVETFEKYDQSSPSKPESYQSKPKNYVGTMYLANHPNWMGEKAFNAFGIRTTEIPQRNHKGVDGYPAHFFASIPMSNTQGIKSDNLSAYSIGTPQSNNFVGKTSDCILSVWADKNDKEINENGMSNPSVTLHGHENSPTYFAMLPLIKI